MSSVVVIMKQHHGLISWSRVKTCQQTSPGWQCTEAKRMTFKKVIPYLNPWLTLMFFSLHSVL